MPAPLLDLITLRFHRALRAPASTSPPNSTLKFASPDTITGGRSGTWAFMLRSEISVEAGVIFSMICHDAPFPHAVRPLTD
jgi:hypothetical protein